LHVTIYYERGDQTEYDIDNYAKAVLDALAKAGVFQDDKQVDKLMQERLPVARVGSCYVIVAEVGPAKTEIRV
jgi:Holliday junction resolvase RusA-like endonuclease